MPGLTETGSAACATKPRRRKHSPELKARVIAACQVPGASIAGIAVDHGLHGSIVRRWLRKAEANQTAVTRSTPPGFVPVCLEGTAVVTVAPTPVIRLQCQRRSADHELSVVIDWPAADTGGCLQILCGLLR